MRSAVVLLSALLIATAAAAQRPHPNLVVNRDNANAIKESWGAYPLFEKAYSDAVAKVKKAIAAPIEVPIPRDAGGYTHERHKLNYTEMYLAGFLYSVSGDKKYASFVRDMLMKYADLYPTLTRHPMAASESPGRIFWQSLNESVWLVYVSQAYDCIYEALTPSEREKIEGRLLRPMAKFFMEEREQEFNRIHNHGTWCAAGVGMLGYVLGDKEMIEKALHGSGRKPGGFLRQLDLLFAPDGYYTEGPYYARYALMPFFLFAEAIQHSQPGLKIFEYRGSILQKALKSLLSLTYPDGRFFPINDALKEKDVKSPEVVMALDVAFRQYGSDPDLFAIAQQQNAVSLNMGGLLVAKALAGDPVRRSPGWGTVEYVDGPKGDEGGVGVLRSGNGGEASILLMKYAGHGLSHGHYDELGFLYSDQGKEVIQDYGAVRFINVEPKDGGRYLPETESWAKQTIAHNTLTMDGASQYGGKVKTAQQFHADRAFFSADDPDFQYMSAKSLHAYKGTEMQRTMALVVAKESARPFVIDVLRVDSEQTHRYDLPFYYIGQFLHTNVPDTAYTTVQKRFGKSHGYQHLWQEAEGKADGAVSFTYLQGNRYYTVTASADTGTSVHFVRIGASDPNFNLRNERGVILRSTGTSKVFAAVIEPHGLFDGVNEVSYDASGSVRDVRVLASTAEGTVVEIIRADLTKILFMASDGTSPASGKHTIKANGRTFEWTGSAALRHE